MTTPADLKREISEKNAQRENIEREITLARARLETTGMGMETPLIDSEGFPKPDVDIAAIRADRQKVIVLSNDHKELSSHIEILLHRLHALSSTAAAPPPPSLVFSSNGGDGDGNGYGDCVDARPVADPITVPSRSTHAFAEIDEVFADSPAAAAGLLVGDVMIRFGRVTGQTPNFMQAVAAALAAGEGTEIEAVVLRQGVGEVKVQLVPQQWAGRGLLGCHLQPLQR